MAEPFGSFATYSSAAGEIDTNALVRTGDVALVPFGYHGPAAAAPDYDLYYLNVMAGPDPSGPGCSQDDPGQAWIRDTWAEAGRRSPASLPRGLAAPAMRKERRPCEGASTTARP